MRALSRFALRLHQRVSHARVLSCAALTVLLLVACASAPPATTTARADANADVVMLPGQFVGGRQPDGNTVLLRGRDGWIVIDTGRHAEHTAHIADTVRASGMGVAAIINTHWHLDHIAGNAAIRGAYPHASVWASDAFEGALRGFLADYRAQLAQMLDQSPPQVPAATAAEWRAEMARIDAGRQLAPTQVLTRSAPQVLAGRSLYLGVERNAVSGGDVWVLDADARTLIAGDLVTLPAPLLDTACAPGWSAALAKLKKLEFDRVIPGHGAPLDRAQLARYRTAFDALLVCAASSVPGEDCRDGWLRDATSLILSADRALARGLLDYYVAQVLRAPPERRDRYCVSGAAQ